MEATDGTPRRRSLTPLLFLVLIFALPPMLGWVFYLHPQWLPGARVNNGTLIEPVRAVDSLVLETGNGQPLDWDTLRGQWVLTVVNQGDCGEPCLSRLIEIRQLRRALAADRKRVSRLLILLPDDSGLSPAVPSLPGLEGTLVARTPLDGAENLITAFELATNEPQEYIFVIDPRGSLMMRHPIHTVEPKAILKDLQMLLKASANWVTGE